MACVSRAIKEANIYVARQRAAASLASVKEVARWVTCVVDMFGLDAANAALDGGPKIGWSRLAPPTSADDDQQQSHNPRAQTQAQASAETEEFYREVSAVRDRLRQLAGTATSSPPAATRAALLALCDHVRDHVFANAGVLLDDRDAGQPALLKYVPREQLRAARAQREAEAAARAAARAQREQAEREERERRAAAAALDPRRMFGAPSDPTTGPDANANADCEYSAWDADGVPTRDAAGAELPKSRVKKLRREWERQKKRYDAWRESAGAGETEGAAGAAQAAEAEKDQGTGQGGTAGLKEEVVEGRGKGRKEGNGELE